MEQTLKQFLKQADKVRYDPHYSRHSSDICHIQTSFFPSQNLNISKSLTSLKSLDIISQTLQSNFDCASFLVSQTLNKLQIQIDEMPIDDQNPDLLILAISKLPNLRVLYLDVPQLSKIDFKLITQMTQLTQLHLINLQPIAKESFKLLANLKNLQCFGLIYQNQFADYDISEVFVSLPFISSLTFNFLHLTPKDFIKLTTLTKLTNLHLGYCLSCQLFTHHKFSVFSIIRSLKGLQQLNIAGFPFLNDNFFILKEYPCLKILHVNDCELSLEDIEVISTFPVLEELIAYDNFIDVQCIEILGKNKPNLKRLEFSLSPDIEQAKEFSEIIMTVALSFKDLEVLKMDLYENEDKGFERFCLNSGLIYLRKLKKLRVFECSCCVPQMILMLKSVISCKQLEQLNLQDLNQDDSDEEMKIRTNKQDIRRVMEESKLR